MQTLGFVAAFYLLTKPPSCLLFHLKTAPKTPPDSAGCLSVCSQLLSSCSAGGCFHLPGSQGLGNGENVVDFEARQ